MTLYTVAASGQNTFLANAKSKYYVVNANTGETIWLEQASDGQFADYGMAKRAGHQVQDTDGASISPSGQTGIITWVLGNDGNYLVLSAGDISAIYSVINTFGSGGAAFAQVVTSLADQVTYVRTDTRYTNPAPPRGNGQAITQLAVIQGSNTVLLSQANCSDLASTLNTISST